MSELIFFARIILLYLTIISGSLFISVRFNKKLSECIIINLLAIVFVLYIFGMLNLLLIGTYIVAGLELLVGIGTIIVKIKNKETHILKEKVVSGGFFVFTILFFWFIMIDINKFLPNYDQYSYWSYAAKDMFETNKFIIDPAINIQYPPGQTIIQYYFMKIIGNYFQGLELFSMQLLAFAMLLPWIEKGQKSKIVKMTIAIIIILVPAIFDNLYFYVSSIPEVIMGLLIGTAFYTFLKEENNKFLCIKNTIVLSFLAIIKPTGVFLAIITLIMEMLYKIIELKKLEKMKFKNIIKNDKIKILLVSFIAVILVFTSWTIYKKLNPPAEGRMTSTNTKDNPLQIVLKSTVNTLLNIDYETYKEDSSNKLFLKALDEEKSLTKPVEISITTFVAISLIGSTYFTIKKLKGSEKTKFTTCIICLFVGFVLYCIILQMAYITMFNYSEMTLHSGIDRYIALYLLAIIFMVVSYTLDYLDSKKANKLKYIILLFIIIFITPLSEISKITYAIGAEQNKNIINYGIILNNKNKVEDILTSANAKKDDAIYIVNRGKSHTLEYVLRYTLYPRRVGLMDYTENMNSINIKLKDWIKDLKENYKYVLILEADEKFDNFASSIFENNEIENVRLYKVEDMGETIKLIPTEKIDINENIETVETIKK